MANPIVMPRLGDFMTEGTISKWHRSSGDTIKQGEVIAEIESEKLNYELEAGGNGILYISIEAGQIANVDSAIGYLLEENETPPEPSKTTESSKPTRLTSPTKNVTDNVPVGNKSKVPSTPGARRLAAKLEIDISDINPTGPRGRVTEKDVKEFADTLQQPKKQSSIIKGLPEPTKTVPITGMRKSIADHMRTSLSNTAQLSFFMDIDVTEAQLLKKQSSSNKITISLAHIITKACALALGKTPQLNTVISDGDILEFKQVNIGIAVALKDGLIVPVIRNADQKTLEEIASETTNFAERAKQGTLNPDEVLGGTFTLSVLGVVDGFTPILNSGQSGILGVGRSTEKPVVQRKEIVIREMSTVSLTVDHQVIDGAVAVQFLRRLQQLIERPKSLFS